MCLIYNDTFSHKMHLRRLNLFASSTLSRLGLKCVNKNGFYKRSNSWLSLLTTCFFLFVLNRFWIFVFFRTLISINQIISQRLRIQNTFKEEKHYVKYIWNFINLNVTFIKKFNPLTPWCKEIILLYFKELTKRSLHALSRVWSWTI